MTPLEQELLNHAASLRALALALVGADGADDLVQETALHALRSRPRSGGLGGYFATILRRLASTSRRRERQRRLREAVTGGPAETLGPEAAAVRGEVLERLTAALMALPPHYRDALLHRYFQDRLPGEIAAETGLPIATVKTRLRRALVLLRQSLDEVDPGGWRSSLTAAVGAIPVGQAPARFLFMHTFTKPIAAGLVLIALGALWFSLSSSGAPSPSPAAVGQSASLSATAPSVEPIGSESTVERELRRDDAAVATTPTTGSVRIRVRYERDGAPASGLGIQLRGAGAGHRLEPRGTTDERGEFAFDRVPPGRFTLTTVCAHPPISVTVEAGRQVQVEYRIEAGVRVRGLVVDPDGIPVPGANIEHVPYTRTDCDPTVVAQTDANGAFTVRDLPSPCLVGARANGFVASRLSFVEGNAGTGVELRLELARGGGAVAGIVVDETGQPIADASVAIGGGDVTGFSPGGDFGRPGPAVVRTAQDGRFVALGLPPGPQPVQVVAAAHASQRTVCDVVEYTTVPLRIVMAAEALIHGLVLGDDGTPVEGARVRVGDRRALDFVQARSDAAGRFAVRGLGPGRHTVNCWHAAKGKAEVQLVAGHDDAAIQTVRLSRGVVRTGTVTDEHGEPLAGITIRGLVLVEPAWSRLTRSDADGRFEFSSCPVDRSFHVHASGEGFVQARRYGIEPGGEPIAIVMRREPPATASVVGTVHGSGGAPLPDVSVAFQSRTPGRAVHAVTDAEGRFASERIVPGNWRVALSHPGHPKWRSSRRELGANEVWDLGVVQLPLTGRAHVTVRGAHEAEGLHLRIVERATGCPSTLTERAEGFDSGRLAPGRHDLFLMGGACALQSVPFTVTAGETTNVEVRTTPGVVQTVECDTRAIDNLAGLSVLVDRDGVRVGRGWAPIERGVARSELRLAPGKYSIEFVVPWLDTIVAAGEVTVADGVPGTARWTAR